MAARAISTRRRAVARLPRRSGWRSRLRLPRFAPETLPRVFTERAFRLRVLPVGARAFHLRSVGFGPPPPWHPRASPAEPRAGAGSRRWSQRTPRSRSPQSAARPGELGVLERDHPGILCRQWITGRMTSTQALPPFSLSFMLGTPSVDLSLPENTRIRSVFGRKRASRRDRGSGDPVTGNDPFRERHAGAIGERSRDSAAQGRPGTCPPTRATPSHHSVVGRGRPNPCQPLLGCDPPCPRSRNPCTQGPILD